MAAPAAIGSVIASTSFSALPYTAPTGVAVVGDSRDKVGNTAALTAQGTNAVVSSSR